MSECLVAYRKAQTIGRAIVQGSAFELRSQADAGLSERRVEGGQGVARWLDAGGLTARKNVFIISFLCCTDANALRRESETSVLARCFSEWARQ